MASLNRMVQAVAGLEGTRDLSTWETEFVASIVAKTNEGKNTAALTEKQIDVLERIFNKHFSG